MLRVIARDPKPHRTGQASPKHSVKSEPIPNRSSRPFCCYSGSQSGRLSDHRRVPFPSKCSAPNPSPTDLREATYRNYVYVITSPGLAEEVAGYRLVEMEFVAVELVIVN